MSDRRKRLLNAGKIVIKIGSALLTNNGLGLNKPLIAQWVRQIVELKNQGMDIVIVSSGAVAEGVVRQGLAERPTDISALQAAAAVGQAGLIQAYQAEFEQYQLQTAQILLVHDDLICERRYENASGTLQTLMHWGAIPIVNENDSVANEELQFGDNDTLAALVANIIDADTLVIMTDQIGMFDADPRVTPSASLIREAKSGDESLLQVAGEGGALGRGGMYTKVKAAELASCVGADTVIVGGLVDDVLASVFKAQDVGTLLYSDEEGVDERKAWFKGLRKSHRP